MNHCAEVIVLAIVRVCLLNAGLPVQTVPADADGPVITEFVASNDASLLDSEGESSDWIEIHNPTREMLDLEGWFLTDDMANLGKWEFPEVALGPGGYLVVFASGKDRRDPAGQLHTNFSLKAEGESVAIVKPDGQTVAFAFRDYPPQLVDISYGLSGGAVVSQTGAPLLAEGAPAKALIPTSGVLGLAWTQPAFNDSSWLTGTTGVGYDYVAYTGLDVSAMRNVSRTVYIRVGFQLAETTGIGSLILRMRYEDGFVAWLNGREVAWANAPQASQLTWNSGATATRDDADAVKIQEFDITAYKGALVKGRNVLAVQGLNTSLGSSDLLILPELVSVETLQVDLDTVVEGYLLQPTPSAPNQGSLAQAGPWIRNVTKNPPPPSAAEDLVITAEVSPVLAAIREARLSCRVNYAAENRELPVGGLPMLDNGEGADAVAGDGVYTAVIPFESYEPGDMVRWYVTAEDVNGRISRDPLFPRRGEWPEYYGTVIKDPAITSELPVLRWFTENPAAAATRGGTRASVFFDGEFYDNIFVRRRGGATVGAESKKFVFNRGHPFRFSEEHGRVKEFNLNQNGSDPSYLRQPLAFETHREAGCPSSLSFLMLSVLNRQVDRVGIFVEQVDEAFLERNGLDPRGALYKFVQRSQITPVFNDIATGIEKKTREYEDFSDIRAVVEGLNAPTAAQRMIFVFDHFNLPAMLDYLAARCLLQDTDDIRKNFYFYRDTEGSGEWSIFPWDKDWTFGVVGDGWIYTSHPFLGDQAHPKNDGRQWSVFLDVMYNLPETREMFLRRTRTVMDERLQSPSTPADRRFFENRISQLLAPARPHLGGIDGAVNSLKGYFPTRRVQLYIDHNANRSSQPVGGNAGIPDAQPEQVTIVFGDCEYNPPSGNQDEEYVELVNPNADAVDISGWRLDGGPDAQRPSGPRHTFLPGTVLVAGSRLYVSPNVRAFRSRTATPRGGQGHFVQGNYQGHLSSWGETIHLLDRNGRLVDTLTYAGTPSDQQRYLRVTEIMYNPAPRGDFDNDAYEFIELKNTGPAVLTLDGAKFTGGIAYAFEQGNVRLGPGECIVIVRDRAAFTSRYGGNMRLAPGTYTGSLNNNGDTIKLEDRTNSTILDFEYEDDWYSATDGQGLSLTIRNAANPDLASWDKSSAWQLSTQQGGSPGSDG